MKIKFKATEPNLQLGVNLGTIFINFDANAEVTLSDDHPAVERMKIHFPFEEVSEAADEEKQGIKCRKCGEVFPTKAAHMNHCRKMHPKE